MNRRLAVALLAGASGAVAIANPLFALPPGTEDYNKNGTANVPCDNTDDSIVVEAPPALWPPNHKYYKDIVVTAVGSDGDEEIVLTTTGTHNQYEGDVEQNGTGNTGDDVRPEEGYVNEAEGEEGYAEVAAEETGTGTAAETWWARAERSGHKSELESQGRQYDFTFNATFDNVPCFAEPMAFDVVVPHDMRTSNRD